MIKNILINILIIIFFWKGKVSEEDFTVHIADPKKGNLEMHWKDSSGKPYRSFKSVKKELEKKGQKLIFAMNGGMYEEDRSPVGLYVENGKELNRKELNLHEFASFFRSRGCRNALYLDGTISSVYLPEKGEDFLGGDFGVIITEKE